MEANLRGFSLKGGFMNSQKDYWDNEFLQQSLAKPTYDFWLDKYKGLFEESKDASIVDLGCGRGNNSLYLIERGCKVISCDISEVAISRVMQHIPQAKTMIFDMLNGLPFMNESLNIVIADLCLHYFSWNETINIVHEIKRVLVNGGYLLFRVNSVNDTNFGAGQGIEIEKNFYEYVGNRKRFFDKKQIEDLFIGWEITNVHEYRMERYKLPKMLWEAAARKTKQKTTGGESFD